MRSNDTVRLTNGSNCATIECSSYTPLTIDVDNDDNAVKFDDELLIVDVDVIEVVVYDDGGRVKFGVLFISTYNDG